MTPSEIDYLRMLEKAIEKITDLSIGCVKCVERRKQILSMLHSVINRLKGQ